MSRSMQLFSCSMRSGVQVPLQVPLEVPLETGVRGDAGAMPAGSGGIGAVGAIDGDRIGGETPDGAIDGDMKTASLNAAAGLGRRQGVVRAQRATARKRNLEAKIDARLKSRSGNRSPDVTPCRWQPVRRIAPPSNYAAFTEPHPASRMTNPLSEWRPYAATQSGPLLVAVERELSPNQTVARFDSPAKS